MVAKEQVFLFENWFSITLPDNWELERDNDILNIYSQKNPKGVLQISFYRNYEKEPLEEVAKIYLDKFINQFLIEIDNNTYKIIEGPSFTLANVSGKNEGDFIKIWIIVNDDKLLLATYNSANKTRELSKIDDIVYSIDLEVD